MPNFNYLSLLIICSIFFNCTLPAQNLPEFVKNADKEFSRSDSQSLKKKIGNIINTEDINSSYNNYVIESLHHRKETFEWQLWASKILFFVVILVVLSGLVISYLQFYNAYNLSKKNSNIEEKGATEIELKLEGIKVKSSLIGFLILTISIAFFYLYLVHVFPIKEVNIDQKAHQDIQKIIKENE